MDSHRKQGTARLGGDAPLHLIAQQVRYKRHADVEADAVEEEEELQAESQVLPCGMQQRAEAQPVEHDTAQSSKCQLACMQQHTAGPMEVCTECQSKCCIMLYALGGGTTQHAVQGCNASAMAVKATCTA